MAPFRSLMLVLLALWLGGCATTRVDPAAFAKPRKLALVSVSATVTGLGTFQKEDKAIVADLERITVGELGRSRHFRLVSGSAVHNARAYKAIKDKGPILLGVLADGYKRFYPEDEAANLKALARELKVDGFLFIQAALGSKNSSVGVSGILPVPVPVTVGREKAFIGYFLYAADSEGDIFWRDQIDIDSEKGIAVVMGVGKYGALKSMFPDLMKLANRKAVETLEQKVSGTAVAKK